MNEFLQYALLCLASAGVNYWIASARGDHPVWAVLLGIVLGPAGVIAAYFIPFDGQAKTLNEMHAKGKIKKCESCAEFAVLEAKKCEKCGAAFLPGRK